MFCASSWVYTAVEFAIWVVFSKSESYFFSSAAIFFMLSDASALSAAFASSSVSSLSPDSATSRRSPDFFEFENFEIADKPRAAIRIPIPIPMAVFFTN